MHCSSANDKQNRPVSSSPKSIDSIGGMQTFADVDESVDAGASEARSDDRRSEAEPRPPSDEVGASPLLEQEGKHCSEGNESPDSRWEISPCRCKSWFCSSCCTSQGIKLKDKLIHKLDDFEGRQMWTLTIDPELFDSPVEAYNYVRKTRAISKLVAALDKLNRLYSRQYFVAVEWQKNGMVHYHILLDTTNISHELVTRLWGKFRPKDAGPVKKNKSPFGFVFYSKIHFESAKGAAGYLCKYLIKHPDHGYPDWVLDYDGQVRRYHTSKGFFPDPRAGETQAEIEAEADAGTDQESEEQERKPRRTIRERLAECKQNSVLMFAHAEEQDDGTLKWKRQYLAELPAPLEVIAAQLLKPYTGERIIIYQRELEKLVELEYKLPEFAANPMREPERIQAFDDYNASSDY